MKKLICVLAATAMGLGVVACSDDSSSCEQPALVAEAQNLANIVNAAGNDCATLAQKLAEYSETNGKAFSDAYTDYKSVTNNGTSVAGILCGTFNTLLLLQAHQSIVDTNTKITNCDGSETSDEIKTNLAKFTSLDGWIGALDTANTYVQEHQGENQNESGN